jgi:predicted nucleotidyltransferase
MKESEMFGLPTQVFEQLERIFRSEPRIKAVTIFGSRAKGNYRNNSDIDLCVEANALTLVDLFKLNDEIDELYLPWKVDLILMHSIDNKELVQHIQRVGRCVFCSDKTKL